MLKKPRESGTILTLRDSIDQNGRFLGTEQGFGHGTSRNKGFSPPLSAGGRDCRWSRQGNGRFDLDIHDTITEQATGWIIARFEISATPRGE